MAKRVLVLAILLFILQCSAGHSQMTERPEPIRPVDGRIVFQNYCAPCHGSDARGKGPVSGALRNAVPDLTTLSSRNGGYFPGAHVKKVINFGQDAPIPAHGSKGMPIWGPVFHEIEFDEDLGNVRLENVTSYLRSVQREAGR